MEGEAEWNDEEEGGEEGWNEEDHSYQPMAEEEDNLIDGENNITDNNNSSYNIDNRNVNDKQLAVNGKGSAAYHTGQRVLSLLNRDRNNNNSVEMDEDSTSIDKGSFTPIDSHDVIKDPPTEIKPTTSGGSLHDTASSNTPTASVSTKDNIQRKGKDTREALPSEKVPVAPANPTVANKEKSTETSQSISTTGAASKSVSKDGGNAVSSSGSTPETTKPEQPDKTPSAGTGTITGTGTTSTTGGTDVKKGLNPNAKPFSFNPSASVFKPGMGVAAKPSPVSTTTVPFNTVIHSNTQSSNTPTTNSHNITHSPSGSGGGGTMNKIPSPSDGNVAQGSTRSPQGPTTQRHLSDTQSDASSSNNSTGGNNFPQASPYHDNENNYGYSPHMRSPYTMSPYNNNYMGERGINEMMPGMIHSPPQGDMPDAPMPMLNIPGGIYPGVQLGAFPPVDMYSMGPMHPGMSYSMFPMEPQGIYPVSKIYLILIYICNN